MKRIFGPSRVIENLLAPPAPPRNLLLVGGCGTAGNRFSNGQTILVHRNTQLRYLHIRRNSIDVLFNKINNLGITNKYKDATQLHESTPGINKCTLMI